MAQHYLTRIKTASICLAWLHSACTNSFKKPYVILTDKETKAKELNNLSEITQLLND